MVNLNVRFPPHKLPVIGSRRHPESGLAALPLNLPKADRLETTQLQTFVATAVLRPNVSLSTNSLMSTKADIPCEDT